MRSFSVSVIAILALAACGSDGGTKAPDAATSIDAPVAGAPTCADYCAKIATNCTAANQQYSSAATCMASCALFPVGTTADTSGNTLGCRAYHANNAATGPTVHCRHAGPGGDGVCGANCDGFCTIVQGACSTQPTPPYADKPACMAACANFATTPVYDQSVQTGNSLACRMYHATAATTTPSPHCNHVKIAGGGGPGFPCQ